MSLEGFSKKGMELGNSPEQINEAKNDLRQQYLNAIKKLALQKMRNDLLFEGSLGAAMKNLSSIGLDVSKESMLKDIETEVNRQRMSFDIEMPNVNIEVPNVIAENQSEIEQLKSNLGSIFESAPVQEQKPIYNSGTIPREPAIQNTQPYETIINNTLSQINQPVQTPVNNEQEIRQQLQKAQEEIRQKLERTRQQPIQEQPQQISQDESKKILQERQKQMKDQIISQIMAGMNNAGEFSFGDISMAERMNIMQNVQNKLNAKSIDELQMLLSTYQEQNIQEETISNGMRR